MILSFVARRGDLLRKERHSVPPGLEPQRQGANTLGAGPLSLITWATPAGSHSVSQAASGVGGFLGLRPDLGGPGYLWSHSLCPSTCPTYQRIQRGVTAEGHVPGHHLVNAPARRARQGVLGLAQSRARSELWSLLAPAPPRPASEAPVQRDSSCPGAQRSLGLRTSWSQGSTDAHSLHCFPETSAPTTLPSPSPSLLAQRSLGSQGIRDCCLISGEPDGQDSTHSPPQT